MDINIHIPNEKLIEFRDAFLADKPIAVMPDPNNPQEEIAVPTEKQWFKYCILQYIRQRRRSGARILAEQNTGFSEIAE